MTNDFYYDVLKIGDTISLRVMDDPRATVFPAPPELLKSGIDLDNTRFVHFHQTGESPTAGTWFKYTRPNPTTSRSAMHAAHCLEDRPRATRLIRPGMSAGSFQ